MNKKYNKGITLIEVVLTVALLGILLSVDLSLFGLGEKSHALVNREFTSQADIRVSMQKISNHIRNTSAVFLHKSIDSVFRENIYDFGSNNTLVVDEDYMSSKGKSEAFKTAVEEKYKGWNFIVLSQDGKELRNFIYNEDESGHYWYNVERIIAPTDTVYELTFDKLTPSNEYNLVQFKLIAKDPGGRKNEIVTEMEALNSLQVVDRGNNENPATVLFYRTEDRPMTEDVSGAMVFVLDTSGSMSDYTRFNNGSVRKINALKSVSKDFLTKFKDRSNLQIGIVEFNDAAHTPISLRSPLDETLMDEIDDLSAGGGTNVGDGIRVAYHMLKDYNDIDESHKEANKYMILLMDGMPTFGAFQYNPSSGDAIRSTSRKHDINTGIWKHENGKNYYYLGYSRSYYYYGEILDISNYKDLIIYYYTSLGYLYYDLKDGFELTGDGGINNNSIKAGMNYIDKMVERMNIDNMENLKVFLVGFFTDDDNSDEEDNFDEIQEKLTGGGREVKPYHAADGDELREAFHAINNIILDDYWHIYGPKE